MTVRTAGQPTTHTATAAPRGLSPAAASQARFTAPTRPGWYIGTLGGGGRGRHFRQPLGSGGLGPRLAQPDQLDRPRLGGLRRLDAGQQPDRLARPGGRELDPQPHECEDERVHDEGNREPDRDRETPVCLLPSASIHGYPSALSSRDPRP